MTGARCACGTEGLRRPSALLLFSTAMLCNAATRHSLILRSRVRRRSPAQATISNDGAKILQLLDIVHPAAKMLVDIARAQDAEIGDGTTTVTLLAAEMLRLAKPFIEDGVHPQIIVRVSMHAGDCCGPSVTVAVPKAWPRARCNRRLYGSLAFVPP